VLSGCHVDSNSLSFSETGQALALYENVNACRRTWVVSGVSGEDEPCRSLRGRREDCRIVDAIPRHITLLCSGERACGTKHKERNEKKTHDFMNVLNN